MCIQLSFNEFWFALNTGVSHVVTKIRVTNRADCCAERTSNLRVGVTDNAPAPGQFVDPDSYTLCGEIPGNHVKQVIATGNGVFFVNNITLDLIQTTVCEFMFHIVPG